MRHVYSALLYLMQPVLLLRLLWRSMGMPAYRQRLAERYGLVDAPGLRDKVIWLHAVSLGEVQAAAPLVEALLRVYRDHDLVITTTTPTGSERVTTLFGERVFHSYAPWDLPGSVGRFLRRLQPRLLVLMETELWPNTLHACRLCGCRVVLANARLSQRSADGYARFPVMTRSMLESLDVVACQSDVEGHRFIDLGLPANRLHVTGSLKFELRYDDQMRSQALELRSACGADGRPVLLAASTHPGEEELVLAAFGALCQPQDNCLLMLAPRHPERAEGIESLCQRYGHSVKRWSALGGTAPTADIVLVDTVGELQLLQSLADVVLVGGSLVNHGGHNPLEAAAWGVPTVCGPSMENFSAIARQLVEAGAMISVSTDELSAALSTLFGDRQQREMMGDAGLRVVEANRGALDRLLQLVGAQLAG